MANKKRNADLDKAQIDMMLFFVLAKMFPSLSDTDILDVLEDVKFSIEETLWEMGHAII